MKLDKLSMDDWLFIFFTYYSLFISSVPKNNDHLTNGYNSIINQDLSNNSFLFEKGEQ